MTPTSDDAAILRTPFRSTDPTFAKLLLGSLLVHFTAAAAVAAQPMPVEDEAVADVPFTRTLRLPRKAPPKEVVAVPPGPVGAPVRPAGASAPRPPPSRRTPSGALAGVGLLGVIGSAGGHGALTDVFEGQDAPSLAQALDGAAVKRLATAGLENLPRDGEGPRAETIGPLGTLGAREVKLGERVLAPPPKVPDFVCFLPKDPPELTGLSKFVTARKRAVQSCYERELKRSPTLKGRLVVRLHLDGPGRAADVDVDDEGLGSDAVASCVRTIVGAWVFPFAGRADVELPFLFNPTN